MAKDRHRIFEIYESRDEAAWELMPKVHRAESGDTSSETWNFNQLDVSRLGGITLVRFKEAELLAQDIVAQLQDEFAQVAEKLNGNSRVLIDFTNVRTFGSAGINVLIVFSKKLQVRGSRMVLCCLDASVRSSFFAAP